MDKLSIDEVIEHCNRTCEKFETISVARNMLIESKQYQEYFQVAEWLEELKKVRTYLESLRNFNTNNEHLEKLKELVN